MAQQSKEQGEVFVKNKMAPFLLKVSTLLSTQAEELGNLKNSVTVDVDNLVKRVNMFSNEVVENVDILKTSVERYSVSNNDRVNMLMAKNKEIQESEKKFKDLLDTLMKSYAEHSQLVASNTEYITKSSTEGVEEVKSLVGNTEEILEKVSSSKSELISNIEAENNSITEFVKTSTETCQNINIDVGKENEMLGSVLRSNTEEVEKNLDKFVEDTKTLVNSQTKDLEEKQSRLELIVEDNKKELAKYNETVVQMVGETVGNDEESVAKLTESVHQLDIA